MQQIQLSIPEPCQQDWQQMTPTQQGRFCNACAKQVIDFTMMSDTEVLNYFSNVKNEKVCGRAYPDQLERTIAMPKYPRKKLFWYWNYITMLFLLFSKSNTVKAQGAIKRVTQSQLNTIKPTSALTSLQAKVVKNSNIIKGKVTDASGNPVAGATVMIKGSRQAVSSDVNGLYKIISDNNNDVLEISAVGFEKIEVKLAMLNTTDIIITKMEMQLMGEVVIVGGMINTEADYFTPVNPKHIVVFEVKDNASMQPVNKAAVIIKKNGRYNSDSVYTDKKGIYKLKKINEDDTYTVKITAAGFKEEILIIKGSDFDERKIVKQIFLEKLPALTDYKKMDSVTVISYGNMRHGCPQWMGAVSVVAEQKKNVFKDSIRAVTTQLARTFNITHAIKIYPNPVQKGNSFNLSLKLKSAGMYSIQITDAAGRIMLQKQINTISKLYTEQLPGNSSWAAGIYYVRVADDKNNLISTNSFSLQ